MSKDKLLNCEFFGDLFYLSYLEAQLNATTAALEAKLRRIQGNQPFKAHVTYQLV